ncbi:hypothetical protein [Chryseobacterium binzhouense]|uniref:hypothetical protein n=1 Tax=Chryseobacterium binzhouense TaxID=2593646 RepID=UPI00117DBEF5|nr:hypothetical protein [Chryseobacterium binzhouense]
MEFKCIMISALFAGVISFAQVGINTTVPQSTLDVNGDITLRNELRVGGTKTTNGNPGTNNQILVSQGDNVTPEWKTSKLGFFEQDEYRITESNATTDEIGINFGNTSTGDGIAISPFGESITSSSPVWSPITDLASSFTIKNTLNRTNFLFQTGLEMSNVGTTTGAFVRFACGIFIDDQLRAIRADQINAINNKGAKNQSIFTLSYTVNNLSAGPHTVKVACRRITSSATGYHFAIGRTTTDGTQTVNNFMLRSILKFDVSEQVKIIY